MLVIFLSPANTLISGLDDVLSIATSEDYIYWTTRKRYLNILKENKTYFLQLPGSIHEERVNRKVKYVSGLTPTAGIAFRRLLLLSI